jgi:hypothetical protein
MHAETVRYESLTVTSRRTRAFHDESRRLNRRTGCGSCGFANVADAGEIVDWILLRRWQELLGITIYTYEYHDRRLGASRVDVGLVRRSARFFKNESRNTYRRVAPVRCCEALASVADFFDLWNHERIPPSDGRGSQDWCRC